MIDVVNFPSPEAVDATAIYAVADIHGRLDLMRAMEAAIRADIEVTRPERAVICYLGDYVDRGPHSARVIERLSSSFDDDVPRISDIAAFIPCLRGLAQQLNGMRSTRDDAALN